MVLLNSVGRAPPNSSTNGLFAVVFREVRRRDAPDCALLQQSYKLYKKSPGNS